MSDQPDHTPDASQLIAQLQDQGLLVFGTLKLVAEDCPDEEKAAVGKMALLVGNAGPPIWAVFSRSLEFRGGLADPLNRWTQRVIGTIAGEFHCRAVYPFGEPFWPFQRLAQRAMGIRSSPLGILIHPDFGLWHAFRAVLIVESSEELAEEVQKLNQLPKNLAHPCDSCIDKPCLTACPVAAFSGEALDVNACFGHIDSNKDPHCMTLGCRARDACPIGVQHRNTDAQVQFHMKSYRGN